MLSAEIPGERRKKTLIEAHTGVLRKGDELYDLRSFGRADLVGEKIG